MIIGLVFDLRTGYIVAEIVAGNDAPTGKKE
jgi:hypothetical protein